MRRLMNGISCVGVGVLSGVLGVSGPAQATPPIVSTLNVDPLVLPQGAGKQPITVSVLVFDPDGDLKNVKIVTRLKDGTKQNFPLVDDGTGEDAVAEDGLFTGAVVIDTETRQRVSLEVKAKDFAKEKARRGAIVSVVDSTGAPILSDLHVTPRTLVPGAGIQVVTVFVTADDPNNDLKKVKLELLAKTGRPDREDALGRFSDDGTSGDEVAGDGVFTIRVPFDPVEPGRIPLRIKAKDFGKNTVALEFDLPVGVLAEPLVEAPIADINDDGVVDALDVQLLTGRIGTRSGEAGYLAGLDLIPDGVLDMFDVDAVKSNFGATEVRITSPDEDGTVLTGRMFDGLGNPLFGVAVKVGTGTVTGTTDSLGTFRVIVPPGGTGVTVASFDGSSALDPTPDGALSGQFPSIPNVPVFINGGVENVFREMSLPELDLEGAVSLTDPETSVVDIGEGAFQVTLGRQLVVRNAGVELRFSEGCTLRPPSEVTPLISITSVNPARLPAPMPPGLSSSLFGTFQPGATVIDCPDEGAMTIVFDNVDQFGLTDEPVFHGIVDGVFQRLGPPCTVVDVDADRAVNDPDDKVLCGPVPVPFEFAWYAAAIPSDPCPATTVVGAVRVNDQDMAPIAGATVSLPGATPVKTDVNGRFTIPNVPAGPNGRLCTDNPFALRASAMKNGDVSISPRVSAVSDGITDLGDIKLGSAITVTLANNGLTLVDSNGGQFVGVASIRGSVAVMATPTSPLDKESAKVQFTVARDQGSGTQSGTIILSLASTLDPRGFTASFVPVVFAADDASVTVDVAGALINFAGTDRQGGRVVSTTPLANAGVLVTAADGATVTFDPNALRSVLAQSGLASIDAVDGTFTYAVETVGMTMRLSAGPDPCPEAVSCQVVTKIEGIAVAQ